MPASLPSTFANKRPTSFPSLPSLLFSELRGSQSPFPATSPLPRSHIVTSQTPAPLTTQPSVINISISPTLPSLVRIVAAGAPGDGDYDDLIPDSDEEYLPPPSPQPKLQTHTQG
ncbi:hypothetical protein CY34DRAFT_14821 [Suillus luteus UH-Slu-Lm8-n1]|uniref:Uncharacterized protein n=1 Tax=Suillus luteus UH-Slu-Lm8-n1 TaxID=930992 RepID=A0A0D0B4I8_9AGAM|nr:hypothetical protein CY34DRAFT_14821 [Suillus luteus UH-Slu-Lm8-n1]